MRHDTREFEWTFHVHDLELLRQAAHRFIPALREDIGRLSDDELAARLVDVMKAGGLVAIMRTRRDQAAMKGVNSLLDFASKVRKHAEENR